MVLLTREDLLRPRLKRRRIALDSLGGEVYVRQLSGLERVEYEQWTTDDDSPSEGLKAIRSMVRLLVLSLVDEEGNPLLEETDLDAVGKAFPFEDLEAVFRTCLSVNGLAEDALEAASKN